MNLRVISELLEKGQVVESLRPVGGSMTPVIKSRQPVTLRPIVNRDVLKKGDIVLVRVKSNIYLHFILIKERDRVQIGNNRGGINGWTSLAHVYGVVTAIDEVPRRNSQYPT